MRVIDRLFTMNEKTVTDIKDLYRQLDEVWKLEKGEYLYLRTTRIGKLDILFFPTSDNIRRVRELIKLGNVFPFPADHKELMTDYSALINYAKHRKAYSFVFEELKDGVWCNMPVCGQYHLLELLFEEVKPYTEAWLKDLNKG